VVNMMKTVAGLGEKFSDSPAISVIADQATSLETALRANFIVNNVVGVGSIAAGGVTLYGVDGTPEGSLAIPGLSDLYEKYVEEPLTTEGGLSAGQVGALVNVATPVIGIPLQGFRWALSSL